MDRGRRAHHDRKHGFVIPVLLFVLALAGGISVWGITTLRNSAAPSIDGEGATAPVRSGPFLLAYTIPDADQANDLLVLRSLDRATPSTTIASFPSFLSFHAHGSASPDGIHVAVLHVADSFGQTGTLSIVDLNAVSQVDAAKVFDLNSRIAWSGAGNRLAVIRTRSRDDVGRLSVDVIEVDSQTGAHLSTTNFDAVLDAEPVGYAPGSDQLYVAIVDQSGSTLWSVAGGSRQRVASFSPGRTRDWSLSPDGTRLAFVDVFGPGDRSYAGSTFHFAGHTVSVSTASSVAGNELGAAWRPGSSEPGFGGPGGSLQLTGPEKGAYLAPDSWSPDGTMLAVRVYGGGNDPAGSLQVVAGSYRIRLSEDPGASLLGWVGGPAR